MSAPQLTHRDTSEGVLVFDHVSRHFGEGARRVTAVDDVSFAVETGTMCALTGASGSGKSTLVHLAAAMIPTSDGAVRVAGLDVSALRAKQGAELRRTQVGVVFQAYNLIPTLTALENVTLPMEFAGTPVKKARSMATAALERVGIDEPFDRFPDDLSGGEQQRVAIARAVAVPRVVLLADEPTGALDTTTSDLVMELLTSIAHDGTAVMVVTHEPRVASFADRVVNLRDGRLASDTSVAVATPAGSRL